MAKFVCEILLTETPLTPPAQVSPPETGAIVDFWGVIRQTEKGAQIRGIFYEAHASMAEHQLRAIAEQAGQAYGLMQVRIEHRIGFVPAGEASLLVRVESQHRAEAFRGAAWILDELKKRAPIWKQLEPDQRNAAAPTTEPSSAHVSQR